MSQTFRILLIDDNPDERMLAMRELRRELPHAQVQDIANLDSLNQALEQGCFDLVVTDYQLRWTDGLKVLQAVKAHYPNCPVIMFTNSGSEEVAAAAMRSGLDDYVTKSPKHYKRLPLSVQLAWDRAKAQQRANQLENRLQSLLNRLDVGVFRLNQKGQLLEGNAAFLQLLGCTSLIDAQKLDWYEFSWISEKSPPPKHQERELQLQRADGSRIWVWLSEALSTHEGETFIDGLLEDITEAKQAEQERTQLLIREQAARTVAEIAEQRSAFLSEASKELTASLDYEVTLAKLARMSVPTLGDWCSVYLLNADHSIRRLEVVHSDPDREAWMRQLLADHPPDANPLHPVVQVFQTGRSRLIPEISDAVLVAAAQDDADYLNVLRQLGLQSLMLVPLLIRGQTMGAIAFTSAESGRRYTQTDLSLVEELGRRAALAIDNALLYQEAQEANRMKDEFLAVLSHELRTPLNAILGWSTLLRSRKFDEPTMARALETIERNAKSQTQLIEDLLDVSRMLQGKFNLRTVAINLVTIIEAAIDAVHLAAEAKLIQLNFVFDPSVGLVSGDPDRLQQVIGNLLSNAIKFTPQGGQIDVGLRQINSNNELLKPRTESALLLSTAVQLTEYAQITVKDSGIGIKPEFLAYVFDRFRQADSTTTRFHGGLGLGLAIVRHLVELHGGTVQATSPGEGQGSTFIVNLPLLKSRPSQPSDLNSPDLSAEELPLKGVRVLAVDDEVDTRELLIALLGEYGASAIAAASAVEAIAILQQSPIDVLVSDIGMPGEDGYALIRRVRALGDTAKKIPAIALTAYARKEDVDQALAIGFQQHLPKPIYADDLVKTIVSVLRSNT